MTSIVKHSARVVALAVGLGLLAGCTAETQDAVARESAKSVVNSILASRFPGVPTAPVTDCVIDNATAGEILTLGSAALTGVTASTQSTVTTILQRPGTINCIATTGISGVLAAL